MRRSAPPMPSPFTSTRTRRRSSIAAPLRRQEPPRGEGRVSNLDVRGRPDANGAGQEQLFVALGRPALLPSAEPRAQADLVDAAGVGVFDGGGDEEAAGSGRSVGVTAADVVEEAATGSYPNIDRDGNTLGCEECVEEHVARPDAFPRGAGEAVEEGQEGRFGAELEPVELLERRQCLGQLFGRGDGGREALPREFAPKTPHLLAETA